jgi:hypothetical protein
MHEVCKNNLKFIVIYVKIKKVLWHTGWESLIYTGRMKDGMQKYKAIFQIQ